MKLGRRYNPKQDEFRLWYHDGARLVGSHKMPQLAPQHHVPHDVRCWSERSQIDDLSKHWIDFFIDDYRIEPLWNALIGCVKVDAPEVERLWRRMDAYMGILSRAEGVIGTDFSMLPEMLPDQRNWNCVRNRVFAYYLESNGVNVIPVACWCEREDFGWCFDGLPEESTIAISTNGCLSTKEGIMTLLEGVEELVRQKNPWLLVVCGRAVPQLEDICGSIMYYPAFSQRMSRRLSNG